MRRKAFWKMPRGSIAKNYRLHAILGAIAEADDRYADSSAEYSLALNNLPAQVPEGPLYPIELRLESLRAGFAPGR